MADASPNTVYLRLLYNAFEPSSYETHELQWRMGATVADYLEGLPPEAEWMVFVNGREIDLVTEGEMVLDREDTIGLILVPQGGNGGMKSVFRIVLQAAAIAAMFVPGVGWAAALAINIGIGLINTFLLTPKPPKGNSGDTSQTYGIDGAKNSATEGIVYPVVQGEFRTGGNFSDCYTVNVGDTQYLYLRAIINDGLIDSINDIEINEQPLSSFADVETRIALGSLDQGVNDWFEDAIVQENKNQKLDTGWNTHITTGPVDKIRWDVVFTQGLVDIDSKKGDYRNRSVTFQMEVREIDPQTKLPVGVWTPAVTSPSTYPVDLDGNGKLSLAEIMGARLYARATAQAAATAAPAIEYRQAGTTTWNTYGVIPMRDDPYVYDAAGDGSIVGDTDITPMVNAVLQRDLAPGNYEFRPVNGAQIVQVVGFPNSASLSHTVTDKRTKQIRRTFETGQLKKGWYEARIRRTTATSTDQYKIDEAWLADIAEIEMDQVAQVGTASLSLKIKLTEQLNSIPTVTARVRGSVCQQYDSQGNPTIKAWTRNPAWLGLDILCGEQRGVGVKLSRIDWPRWVEFAERCEANKLYFNGVHAEGSNVGDVLNQVLRIGHAAPIPLGTKISVAIDEKRDPVAFFGPANILKDSFEISYMSMADRANEYELTYYDRLDRNKAKTIRYVDPKAVRFNEMPRLASVQFPGIDNIDQARTELWRLIYANRLLMRTITFDSFLDSINLAIGENALIQHNQMAWAKGGRLEAGSTTTTLNLDIPVEIEAGKNYAAIVHLDAVNRGTRTITSIVGRKVLVSGASIASLKAKRLVVGDNDYEIASLVDGTTFHTITLADAPTGLAQGQNAVLWDTDVIVELPVTSGASTGTKTIQLASPLPVAPAQYTSWVFGEVKNVKKPFTLIGVSGNGVEKRKLTFIEYHDGVYGPPEVEIPIPVQSTNDRNVGHVQGLLFDYERLVSTDRSAINARVHWSAAGIVNYGGADVYMAVNGGPFRAAGNAAAMEEFAVTVNANDRVEFKVVAYNRRGDRAPIATAPSVAGTIAVQFAAIDAPRSLDAIVTNFQVDGRVQLSWQPPADALGVQGYRVRYRKKASQTWIDGGTYGSNVAEITGLDTATWVVQVQAFGANGSSAWIEKEIVIAVLPGSLMANFLNSNDRNANPIPAPVTRVDVDVDHVINTDGSADISFEWEWSGDEASIDGFEVQLTVSDT